VAARIKKHYGRDADVIYPPVDTEFYRSDGNLSRRGDFFLIVSALVPYKRIEVAIDAFRNLSSRLVIIGQGTERRSLEQRAPSNVKFLGWVSNEEVRDRYRRCRAVLFPGIEDFGIVPLEAQACGTPVIAFRAGGALETVIEGETGLFFEEQSSDSLRNAIRKSEIIRFDPLAMRQNAERFSKARFVSAIKNFISRSWASHKGEGEWPW
jgi:glycosyltransferase involved in cell wall biosynthesis